jgi:hypothetical protein
VSRQFDDGVTQQTWAAGSMVSRSQKRRATIIPDGEGRYPNRVSKYGCHKGYYWGGAERGDGAD